MSKYNSLYHYLLNCKSSYLTLSFSQIEEILGFDLPKSAYIHPEWWANSGHSHASSWTGAGYKTIRPNLSEQIINFYKDGTIFANSSTLKCESSKREKSNTKPKTIPYVVSLDSIELNGYPFSFLERILPLCDEKGNIIKYYPQKEYYNKDSLPLLPHGNGAFCRFSICAPNSPGVYLWVVDKEIIYIGETANLRQRFNAGYGNISPRNCYLKGQNTNCKMNKVVLDMYEKGKYIDIFFYETSEYKAVELTLLKSINTKYNEKDNQ